METVYIAGGCLWGVQHFFDSVPGVLTTEAGRANGKTDSLDSPYDGYAECVKVVFDEKATNISNLMEQLFEIIDPYSLNKQGVDVGEKYRTGIYSTSEKHLEEAKAFIDRRVDRDKIVVEVLPADKLCQKCRGTPASSGKIPGGLQLLPYPGCNTK